MKKTIFALAALSVLLVGCGSTEAAMSKQEEQDFKGKPIPPDVLEKMKANAGKPKSAPTGP
jgi:predicted component of type VI protein secretion system